MTAKPDISLRELGITAITFDLDDTLWPCAPVISQAEQVYFDWIAEHFPEVARKYNRADVLSMRRSKLDIAPQLANDVTELRRLATLELLQPFGASDSQVQELLRVCIAERQKVTLYDDVMDSLQQLSFHYRLGSITNGNADLGVIGIANLFDAELAATMSLPAKPAADMFIKAFDLLGVQPESVLHVGDHPVNDVVAARDAGCRTAWMNRSNEAYPVNIPHADIEITNLHDLVALAPSIH